MRKYVPGKKGIKRFGLTDENYNWNDPPRMTVNVMLFLQEKTEEKKHKRECGEKMRNVFVTHLNESNLF